MKRPLKKRYKELEKELASKKHELEIEVALEKVRSRTMYMQKSEELAETSYVLFQQFKKLGETSDQFSIGIFNEEKNIIELYSTLHGSKWKDHASIDFKESMVMKKIYTAWKKKKKSLVIDLFGNDLKKYNVFRNKVSGIDYKEKRWVIHIVFFSRGVLTFSTTIPHPKETVRLLKRFAGVFDGTYTRFLDLQKAEAQAREAQIEAALERVRAKTMAMYKGNELGDTALLLFEQIALFGIKLTSCGFLIMDDASETMEDWSANLDEKGRASIITGTLAFNQHPMISNVVATWRKRSPYFIGEIHGNDLQQYYEAVTSRKSTSKVVKEKVLSEAKSEFTNSFFFEYGMMYALTPKAISASEINIMLRFAKVFKQTYTRFLDLQKAEEQVREAQIEAALERVRARTMAMQKSDELSETVYILFQQFKELGEKPDQATIGIINEDEKVIEYWVTMYGNQMNSVFKFSIDEPHVTNKIYKAWKENKTSIVIDLSGKELNEFAVYRESMGGAAYNPKEKYRIINIAFFSKGLLNVQSNEARSEESIRLLERFASVFEQTYTRFLDLQKAEAQARESQIQLALERVRARTMAMQKSEELRETTSVLFQQFKTLGIIPSQVSICIFDVETKMGEMYVTLEGEKIDRSFPMELDKEVFVMKNAKKAFLEKQKIFSHTIKGKELQRYNQWRNSFTGRKGYDESDTVRKKSWYVNAGFFSRGMMGISSETPVSDEAIKLLERFAKVFDLTFTRFLDLQKAEAQAREAKIEAALEKVRAQSMAMSKSEDLALVVSSVFSELEKLDVKALRCGIGIINGSNKNVKTWITTTSNIGNTVELSGDEPLTGHALLETIFTNWKAQKSFSYTLEGNDLIDYYKKVGNTDFQGELAKEVLSNSNVKHFYHCVMFPVGGLFTFSEIPFSEETYLVLKRFGDAFYHAYKRFEDLQRAEAQARESQIQLALERVRARTMAMQKSDELADTAVVLFQQFAALGETPDRISIGIIDEKNNVTDVWATDQSGTQLNIHFKARNTERTTIHKMIADWKAGKKSAIIDLQGDDLKDWITYLRTELKMAIDDSYFHNRRLHQVSFFSQGWLNITSLEPLPVETLDLLNRFAEVFNLTYTRFNDLQKAEAQAREARIEASLERVRSRSMGMQKSEELKEVIQIVYEQFVHVNILVEHAGFIMDYKERDDMHIWLADKHLIPSEITIPWFDSLPNNTIKEAKEKEQDFFKYLLTFEEKNKFYQDLFKFIPGVPEETLEYYFNCPGLAGAGVLLDNIGLYIENFDGISYTDEENKILMRFGKVFQQTYTRFLDLQKAEAQAREAKIEAALEKVRAQSMAMSKSEDLALVVSSVFSELEKLDVKALRCGIGIINGSNKNVKTWITTASNIGNTVELSGDEPLTGHALLETIFTNWKAQKSFSYTLEGNDLIDYYKTVGNTDFQGELAKEVLSNSNVKHAKEVLCNSNVKHFYHCVMFPAGGLFTFSEIPFSEETYLVLKRFGDAFYHAYKRFEDLQRAEAQARESQIQLALERVRARTMAMQKSDELAETASVLFQQMNALGNTPERLNIGVINEEKGFIETWATEQGGNQINHSFNARLDEPTTVAKMYKGWKAKKTSMVIDLSGKELKQWIHFLQDELKMPVNEEILQNRRVQSVAYFKEGFILMTTPEPLPTETISLLERFADVFNLTYTRFLDLQKAEAQAREATIEAALERVRSRTMAMFKSSDLLEVISVLSEQFLHLGFKIHSANFNTSYRQKDWNLWLYNPGTPMYPEQIHISYLDNPFFNRTLESIANGDDFTAFVFSKEEKDEFLDHIYSTTIAKGASEERKRFSYDAPGFAWSTVYLKNTALTIANYDAEPYTEEQNAILRRFGNVFEQSYTRFLDLQKAEAQAREAKIEAALEKVRSRSLAMHKSEEIQEVINEVFIRLKELEINLDSANILIFENGSKDTICWTGSAASNSTSSLFRYAEDIDFLKDLIKAKENQLDLFMHQYSREQKNSFFNYVYETTALKETPNDRKQFILGAACHTVSVAFSKNIAINLNSYSRESFTESENNIAKRFAKVFEQSYTRFLDLQKAEAQAREATIEAALERVRGKAMSMHSSRDLADTIGVFYHEMELLSVTPRRCGVGLMDKETHAVELSTMNTTEQGDSIEIIGKLKLIGHPVLEGIYDNWILQKEYHPVLRGNEIKEYYQLIRPQIAYPDYPTDTAQYGYFFFFNEGGVYAWTEKELSEDELKIYRRFTSVLSLTYKRYKDLKDAEASAKEAIKQSALDRIRADIAAMRTINDLDRITPLIWNELTILGIPFIRCGVFIMDDEQQLIHTFLSTPDGKAIAAFHLLYSTPGNIGQVVAHWQKNKNYIDHWDETAFTEFAHSLVKQKALASSEEYMKTLPKGGFYLHFLPFLQGMLYVGNTNRLGDEEINLLQSVADAFSTAYARYEDFNKLENAKQKIENTLSELKSTQQQLIQSEKMASLGELTAGIAHEIQNPLNFVNNFSEVNKEIIDEASEEMDKGNYDEVKNILNDIKENSEKINHHGKRADAIVKGMLQHSRKSSGQKEPTDINTLADEYLRLSYHGLRAKDKSFNATMETNFDETIGKINIIPQDMGRVLLNLFNNAFYAVNTQKTRNPDSYNPTVSVSTKKSENSVLITVSDNGNGIPKNIVDKIFQPFFTTKPTGQGTGLGLSLAYDIIKAHGGTLKVESKEGEGTEFKIVLPAS